MTDIVKSIGVSVKLARENIKLLARAEKAEADSDRLREFVEAVASENLTLLTEIEQLRADLEAADIAVSRLNGGAELQVLMRENNRLRAESAETDVEFGILQNDLGKALLEIERLWTRIRKQPHTLIMAYEDGDHGRLVDAVMKYKDEAETLREDNEKLRAELSRVTISPKAFDHIMEVCENPPPPTEALKALFRAHSEPFKTKDELEIDRLRAALDMVMTGGNHLVSIIGVSHPAAGMTHDYVRAHYGPGHQYEAWCCWSAIMQARAALGETE